MKNTLAEVFALQRFFQPQVLRDAGLNWFDDWAGTFGKTQAKVEMSAGGLYKMVSRFRLGERRDSVEHDQEPSAGEASPTADA